MRVALIAVCLAAMSLPGQDVPYSWREGKPVRVLADSIPVPAGYRRVPLRKGSFGDWLRHLPLRAEGAPVLLYDGSRKRNQNAHWAVVDLDVGTRDLQQCADAVIRLRAEYLFAARRPKEIRFHFTNGTEAAFRQWMLGERPVVRGNRVSWRQSATLDRSHASLRSYLNTVFAYAGSSSLARELKPRKPAELQVGDVFVRGGFPGHAVLVVDVAFHPPTGRRVFLLAQSYMPAQEVHILKNPSDARMSPWCGFPADGVLRTPEWTFRMSDLRRFP
jgi:hypothetical protein